MRTLQDTQGRDFRDWVVSLVINIFEFFLEIYLPWWTNTTYIYNILLFRAWSGSTKLSEFRWPGTVGPGWCCFRGRYPHWWLWLRHNFRFVSKCLTLIQRYNCYKKMFPFKYTYLIDNKTQVIQIFTDAPPFKSVTIFITIQLYHKPSTSAILVYFILAGI